MMKSNLLITILAILSISISKLVLAADTGSCGPTCEYTYDPTTQTLTYRGTGTNGAGEIAYTTSNFNLSGTVKNAIISEGITRVYAGSGSSTIRDIGTQDGKLIIPSTMESFDQFSAYLLGFGTIEINSKNMDFSSTSFQFKSGVNAKVILSADANIDFQNSFFNTDQNRNYYPNTLTISCKGNPDECLEKFGTSLNNMNQNYVTSDYYEERDSYGNLLLKYNDTGYDIYDSNGNVIEKYGLNGNIKYAYGADGSTYYYDKDGNISGIKKKGAFTLSEAAAAVHDSNDNVVSITW